MPLVDQSAYIRLTGFILPSKTGLLLESASAPAAKNECARLDTTIARLEHEESAATKESLAEIQRLLFDQRTKYREFRC